LADSVFYIHEGKVKVTVLSEQGKEAVVAVMGPPDYKSMRTAYQKAAQSL
jgi:CRP/FNR family cyclic AMP-dependent transcriptional regulator